MYKNDDYGKSNGLPIKPPNNWRLLKEGEKIPQVHRVFDGMSQIWCQPRQCHGTMTPPKAMVWGYMQAFAELINKEEKCI